MSDPIAAFEKERLARIQENNKNKSLIESAESFNSASNKAKYSYNFSWMGRPIIQYPQDIIAMQEIIWQVKPDLIIETGIAHGGSLIFSASILALMDMCEDIERGQVFKPHVIRRKVIGIDVEIRSHNRAALEAHPLAQ